jgi:hypothetical protein
MRPSTLRSGLRLFHLIGGIAISAFIYSPTLQSSGAVAALLQFGIVPALGVSGLMMWKPRLLRPVTG